MTATEILLQIDELQKSYSLRFDLSDDIKCLQGVERCIELKMKLLGFDGKSAPAVTQEQPDAQLYTLDLAKLSHATLKEILQQMDV